LRGPDEGMKDINSVITQNTAYKGAQEMDADGDRAGRFLTWWHGLEKERRGEERINPFLPNRRCDKKPERNNVC